MVGTVFGITRVRQGYRRLVPDGVWSGAAEQARGLGHGWIGCEHVLLVLLATPSVASETLEELGVSREVVVERMRGSAIEGEPRTKGLHLAPAAHALRGRADAFAAVDGARPPGREHWLLALVWDDKNMAVQLLHGLGATQPAILDGLRARRVRVPDLGPPRYAPWRGRHTIEIDEGDVRPLLNLLIREHPPGSEWRWGVNWTRDEPRRGIFVAEEGIDLDAALRASRGDGGKTPVSR
jgi:hypothetical protein